MCCAKRRAFPGFLTYVLLLAAVWAQSGQSLPEGRGRAEFERVCAQCHGLQIIVKRTNSPDGWADLVDDMIARGAKGTDDDFDLVVKYLAENFGPKVNVNRANAQELSEDLELSTADAEAIVHYRETAGNFRDWHDLEKVPHIDLKKLEQEKNRIEFATAGDASGDKK